MEVIINENGCRQLREDLLADIKKIAQMIGTIEANNTNLKAALGDDYHKIDKSVRAMKSQLESAEKNLSVITADMQEYITRVGQTRAVLD